MRYIRVLLGLLLLLSVSCSRREASVNPLSEWQYCYEGQWLEASVPGCVHTDLLAANLIPDPFYGTHEDSVQWVSQREWLYRTLLTPTMWQQGSHCDLVLDGVTLCEVLLVYQDTLHIATCNNMFRQWRVNLSPTLSMVNDSCWLLLRFQPIEQINETYFSTSDSTSQQGITPLSYNLPDHRTMTRMPPYMLGWDWGPKLSTVGILGGARLECYNTTPPLTPRQLCKSWGITLQQEQDTIGQSFTFLREGKPIFVRGANWIPCHSFPILTPAMRSRYRNLLLAAKEANIEMLRVWGGGIYEPDYFYYLCDSLGIMVWQDFNFSCALYPSDSLSLENIREEALYQVHRLSQHPCIVVWCGNNEVQNGWHDWGWQQQYGWTPEQQALLQHGIDTIFGLNGILAQAVKAEDPLQRNYITTSPLYGWGHSECVTHGDSHYWGVWWGEQPCEMYAEKTGRFMSEYGFQSYPDYSTVCRYCPEEERYITSPTMRSHQKHGRGLEIIDKAMQQYYGLNSQQLSLEDYCYVSQLLQAWITGYGIYQHLRQQPHCMGTLYWQFNDCWPVASWSSVDYYGNWKALHYRVQDLYRHDVDLSLYDTYYATYPKHLHLPKACYNLHQEVKEGVLTVTVEAQSDLRDVMLQTEPHVDGHFTSNYFTLSAGESRTVQFLPQEPTNMSHTTVTFKCLNQIQRHQS